MADKSVLIYIKIPENISTYIESLYREVNRTFLSSYKASLNGKAWESHLMLYLSAFPENTLQKVVENLTEICHNTRVFDIKLTDLVYDEYGFVYFKLDTHATKLVEHLHNELVENFKGIRNPEIKPKYLEKWNTFSYLEKQRIETTGLPYPYIPHITIARVSNNYAEKAVVLLKTVVKEDVKFNASTIAVNVKNPLEKDEDGKDIYLIKLQK